MPSHHPIVISSLLIHFIACPFSRFVHQSAQLRVIAKSFQATLYPYNPASMTTHLTTANCAAKSQAKVSTALNPDTSHRSFSVSPAPPGFPLSGAGASWSESMLSWRRPSFCALDSRPKIDQSPRAWDSLRWSLKHLFGRS